MNNILMYNEIPEIGNGKIPQGWVIRPSYDETGKLIKSNIGIYLNKETFISIPIHVATQPMWVELKGNYDQQYYTLKKDADIKLIKARIKKTNRQIPLLVPCRKDETGSSEKSDFIALLAISPELGDIILSMNTDNMVVKSFIDKYRKIAVVIMIGDKGNIMPQFNLTYALGSHRIDKNFYADKKDCKFAISSLSSNTDKTNMSKGKFKTEFISFKNVFIPKQFSNNKLTEKFNAKDKTNIHK